MFPFDDVIMRQIDDFVVINDTVSCQQWRQKLSNWRPFSYQYGYDIIFAIYVYCELHSR